MSDNDSKSLRVVNSNNVEELLQDLENAFWDIPFENSAFQTEQFIIASAITPERAYRSLGLRMHSLLRSVIERIWEEEADELYMEQLKEEINNPSLSKLEKLRKEIELKKATMNIFSHKKTLHDALCELNILYKHYQSLPRYTREQFEAGEYRHYHERSLRGAHDLVSYKESLVNMEVDIKNILNFEEKYKLLPDYEKHRVTELAELTHKSVFSEDVVNSSVRSIDRNKYTGIDYNVNQQEDKK